MKIVHLMFDDSRDKRVCDGKPLARPLPHMTNDNVQMCQACIDKSMLPENSGKKFGMGMSFTQEPVLDRAPVGV